MSNGAETRIRRSREKILAAAEEVFLRHGFLGTNMDAVADKAGVSKQTVYAHFKSKEALFIEVVEAMTGGAAQEIGEYLEDSFGDRPVAEYLLEVAADQLTIVLTPRLMRLRRMVIGEVERFPELGKSLYLNGPKRSIDRLARACEHYTRTGELNTPDPQKAAIQFNWIVMGAPTNAAMLLGDDGIPGQEELRNHAREAVRIFLCAYAMEHTNEK
ncbi:TetR/AcrR family transcriptional regulator [Salaquimonas pukyongi]|uniref:TetR/AcrR family transcriptional regulator n=1 Tax=Salaquimonas pukyongi TaxID=2712698 RepID=UPI00096BA20D|nr:TetR/AcrR family transcriptional regulator [Salaquimonas pukyongi]